MNARPTRHCLKKYDIHRNQINSWKREFISKSDKVCEKPTEQDRNPKEKLIETLNSRIGELRVAYEFLNKTALRSFSERNSIIELEHPTLSIVK